MADDALETQLRRLAALVAPLVETVNQHDARLAAQHEMNRQQVSINHHVETTLARVETTLARIETLLARMIRHEDNGKDA